MHEQQAMALVHASGGVLAKQVSEVQEQHDADLAHLTNHRLGELNESHEHINDLVAVLDYLQHKSGHLDYAKEYMAVQNKKEVA